MIYLDDHAALLRLVQATGKYGIALNIYTVDDGMVGEYWEDIPQAAPCLAAKEAMQIIVDEHGLLLFDTREEMEATFNATKGDDANQLNPYDGPIRVYMMECSPEHGFERDNT